MKLTYGDAKPVIARVIRVCADDARVLEVTNESQQRLLWKGKWVGTYVRLEVCAPSGCITWPRQIETIEAFAVSRHPGMIHDGWYEFMSAGYGIMCCDEGNGNMLVDRNSACTFDDVIGTDKTLRIYCDHSSDYGKQVLIQGHDENSAWKRSFASARWWDGKFWTTAAPYTQTDFYSTVTGIILPAMNSNVRLYEYDTVNLTQRLIGVYEPGETKPIYRRSAVPGLVGVGGTAKSVTVVGKLRHIPIAEDNDWLLVQNLPALKLMAMAIFKEENNLWSEALAYEENARRLLNEQLQHFLGDSPVRPIQWIGADVWGGGVPQLQ